MPHITKDIKSKLSTNNSYPQYKGVNFKCITKSFFILFSFFLKFIVVSLKEGMFNNANVLFKTKFVDGVSTVARFTQCQNGKISKEAKSKAKPPKGAHVEV